MTSQKRAQKKVKIKANLSKIARSGAETSSETQVAKLEDALYLNYCDFKHFLSRNQLSRKHTPQSQPLKAMRCRA